jgi:hypothetical protein
LVVELSLLDAYGYQLGSQLQQVGMFPARFLSLRPKYGDLANHEPLAGENWGGQGRVDAAPQSLIAEGRPGGPAGEVLEQDRLTADKGGRAGGNDSFERKVA